MVWKYGWRRVRELARHHLESFGSSRARNKLSQSKHDIIHIQSQSLFHRGTRNIFYIHPLLPTRYILFILSTELFSEISRDFPLFFSGLGGRVQSVLSSRLTLTSSQHYLWLTRILDSYRICQVSILSALESTRKLCRIGTMLEMRIKEYEI